MRHIPAIDGLRAVAVLAVVAYHAGLPVPAGFVGVDVFFVISGYLITRLLHDEVQATGRIDFLAFYARRARRILPALIVVVLATLGLSSLLLPYPEEVAKSAAAAGVFVANVFFQVQASDYWAPAADSMPLLHLWSLSVEEQFYLVWPVVLILARKRPVAALATLAVVSLALAEWWLWRAPTAAFYQMPSRAWELALGGLVALRPVALPKGSAWAGLAVVLASCFVPFAHFPGIGALPAVAGSALLIAAIQNGERVAPLESRPMVAVGLISYSLYLWHVPLLAIDQGARVGAEAPLELRLALIGLAFVLSIATYRYIETPFRRARARNGRAVGVAVTALALLTGATWGYANAPKPVVVKSPQQLLAERAASDSPNNRMRCHFALRQSLADVSRKDCSSDPARPTRVAIWGDSMALAWQPFAGELAARDGVAATNLSRDDCRPAVGYRPGHTRSDDNCMAFNDWALGQASRMDTVVFASDWVRVTPESMDATVATIQTVARRVRRVVVIGPTPTMRDTVPNCILAGASCTMPRGDFDASAELYRARLKSIPGVEYVEPVDFFCTKAGCPAVRDGMPLYWDTYHVTSSAARSFAAGYLNGQKQSSASRN